MGAGILAVAGGFAIGVMTFSNGDGPDGDAPTRITTADNTTPIPLPASVEGLPALEVQRQTTPSEGSEAVQPETDTLPATPASPEPESGEKPAAPEPEITVAPTE